MNGDDDEDEEEDGEWRRRRRGMMDSASVVGRERASERERERSGDALNELN